jgi:hypothetical protein
MPNIILFFWKKYQQVSQKMQKVSFLKIPLDEKISKHLPWSGAQFALIRSSTFSKRFDKMYPTNYYLIPKFVWFTFLLTKRVFKIFSYGAHEPDFQFFRKLMNQFILLTYYLSNDFVRFTFSNLNFNHQANR